jgi:hypothetical protein
LTSIFDFSDKIREASENECTINKMKRERERDMVPLIPRYLCSCS